MPEDEQRKRAGVEELQARLVAAIESLETGQQWQDWLRLAGRLPHYSFRNLMLIMVQRPDASAVAGYATWSAGGRQVRRGEKSIKILAPITRRVETGGKSARGREISRPDGRQVIGFRPTPVFDIAQTDGPPVPARPNLVLLDGEAPPGLWDALVAEVSARGYRLLRGGSDRLGAANGRTDAFAREVWVRDDLGGAQAAKTLTHELAHVLLHADDQVGVCRGLVEVEAESVAFVVTAAHGLASDAFSFPYVANWAFQLAAVEHVPVSEIVSRTGQRVTSAARTLIDAAPPADRDDHVVRALSDRVSRAAERTADLRQQVERSPTSQHDHQSVLGVLADSQAYFRRRVTTSWVPAYLEGRGLAAAVRSHGIGYAPPGWTSLVDHLQGLGYSDKRIEASGVALWARTGQLVDRFRDRLTLPILNGEGSLVGFTARVGADAPADAPKYLNTSATAVFDKSRVLYGSSRAWERIAAGARPVICEGALDAVAVDLTSRTSDHAMVGLASCGTAFTEEQARLIVDRAGAGLVCLAFDGDEAGANAEERAWHALTAAGQRDVRVAEFAAGADPASLALADPSRLADAITEARGAAFVMADRLVGAHPPEEPGRAVLMFRDLMEWTELMPKEQRVEFALQQADRLGIDPGEAAQDLGSRHPTVFDESTSGVLLHCLNLGQQLAAVQAPAGAGDDPVAAQVDIPSVSRSR